MKFEKHRISTDINLLLKYICFQHSIYSDFELIIQNSYQSCQIRSQAEQEQPIIATSLIN